MLDMHPSIRQQKKKRKKQAKRKKKPKPGMTMDTRKISDL